MTARRFGLTAAAAAWLGLIGCAGLFVNSDWEQASNADTEHAYQQFLYDHGDSKFAAEARRRLERMAWEKAEKTNTLAGYEAFQKRYPQGQFAAEAEQRVERLKWLECLRANNLEAAQAFLKRFPTGAHAAAAQAKVRELTAARQAERDQRREQLAAELAAGNDKPIGKMLADGKLPEAERLELIEALERHANRPAATGALLVFLCTVPPASVSVRPTTTITTYTYGSSPYSGPQGNWTLTQPGGTRIQFQDRLWQRGAEALWRVSPEAAVRLMGAVLDRTGDYERHLVKMLREASIRLRLELLPAAVDALKTSDPFVGAAMLGLIGLQLQDREAPMALPLLIALLDSPDADLRSLARTVLERTADQKLGPSRAAWDQWWRQVAPK